MYGFLSKDVWQIIVNHCDVITLVRVAATSRLFRKLFAFHSTIVKWKTMCPNDGLYQAAKQGSHQLANLFVSKGAYNWNSALYQASRGGHRGLVDLFVSKGANNWNSALYGASEGEHRELVDLFISKGANDWNDGLAGAAKGGHRGLVDLFISKGANNWNRALYGASEGGHRELVDLFISNFGANNLELLHVFCSKKKISVPWTNLRTKCRRKS